MSLTSYVMAVSRERAMTLLKSPPSMAPRPNATNIDAFQKYCRDGLAGEPSHQSQDWGFSGMIEEAEIYALRSPNNPFVRTANPGEHRPIDPALNTAGQNDSVVVSSARKGRYETKKNIAAALAAAMNAVVPEAFRRITGGNNVGIREYRPTDDARTCLANLRRYYGQLSPRERAQMDTRWAAPWNPAMSIETFFARLEDEYVRSVRHPPSYTMDQMIGKAITAITVSGLMQQHRLE